MKRIVLFFTLLFLCLYTNAQVTTMFDGKDRIFSNIYPESAALYSVKIYENVTHVTIELVPTKNRKRMNYWSSENTVLTVGEGIELPIIGFIHQKNGEDYIDDTDAFYGNWGWDDAVARQKYYYTMVFSGAIPPGITSFSLIDRGKNGWRGFSFENYTLNNPETEDFLWTVSAVKQNADENNDGICGIYESTQGKGYALGCVKQDGEYSLIYLGSSQKMSWWLVGDTKAKLRPSATVGIFKAEWLMDNKTTNSNCYVIFDSGSMKTLVDTGTNTEESFYLKMYPTAQSTGLTTQTATWSGTGFALNNGYIATNYHVVENAKSIKVKGIGGNFNIEYDATVVTTDTHNDLAIIKINDSRFSSFGTIPYRVKTTTSEVGEDVFVLGYPLTTTMGDEIKLTTGVISAKTGFLGDVSLYQISAPVQPGNSGGPLFDSQGNLIGIVNAKHTGAENVSYAIKASYLSNLAESASNASILPSSNSISGLPLSEKVKKLKNFTFMITCSR